MEIEPIEITRKTMLGDLMRIVLSSAKAMQKPWQQMNQHEQDTWLSSVDKQCKTAVEQCVLLLAADGAVAMQATLKRVVFKDSVEATLAIAKHSHNRIDLADAAGTIVHLVIRNADEHTTDNGKPKAEANQRPLELDDYDFEAERTDEIDVLLSAAIEFVRKTRKCTIAQVQRHFQIGYNRAARLVEKLEEQGVVSPMDATGKRVVLTETAANKGAKK